MSAAATAPTPTDQPSRGARLLSLVRKLIDYGRQLATSFQQRTADLAAVTRPFGTSDIAAILARIAQGLQRASALEARLVRNAACLEAPWRPAAARLPRVPRVARPTTSRAEPAGANLACLPTAEQIAAEVRRRPVGAVIADICRDLGIMPCHPLWPELSLLIIRHGGSLARLVNDIADRVLGPVPRLAIAAAPAPAAPSPAPAGTGPP